MTTLQDILLHWLRGREEQPTRRDLFAEFSGYRPATLERAMAKLVRDGWATTDGTRWTTP